MDFEKTILNAYARKIARATVKEFRKEFPKIATRDVTGLEITFGLGSGVPSIVGLNMDLPLVHEEGHESDIPGRVVYNIVEVVDGGEADAIREKLGYKGRQSGYKAGRVDPDSILGKLLTKIVKAHPLPKKDVPAFLKASASKVRKAKKDEKKRNAPKAKAPAPKAKAPAKDVDPRSTAMMKAGLDWTEKKGLHVVDVKAFGEAFKADILRVIETVELS